MTEQKKHSEIAALEKRLAESESWRGMIDKFVIAIMDELRCGKACGGIDGDQNDPDSTTQVVLQAIRDSWQAAIDAALESVKEYLESAIQYRIISGDLYMVGRNDAFRDAAGFIESRIGTNPLAERAAEYARRIEFRAGQLAEAQAKIKELNGLCLYHEGFERELRTQIAELERELSEQADTIVDGLAKRRELERERDRAIQHHERCAEKLFKAERELAEQLERNKLLKHTNSLFANSGDNDELAIDQLRRELAEARTLLAIAANYLQEHWDMESVPLRGIQAAAMLAEREKE